MSPCACTQLHGRTCGITLVDLARKQPLLVSPKVRGFGEEQSQCVLGPTAQNVNPLIFGMNKAPAESHSLPCITLRLTGLTETPWPSRLFWGGESAPSLPARMTRQESCQLPFSCWSSSSLHKHTATTPTLYLASVDLTLLLSTGIVLEHNNKVTRDRFNRSCLFPCYGNQSQEPKSCPGTGILCAALS